MVAYALEQVEFLSTPSARRATYSMDKNKMSMMISIHALCEEGDLLHAVDKLRLLVISIHALCEEGDPKTAKINANSNDFYPRPLRGGRQCPHPRCQAAADDFYPRPLRGGRLAMQMQQQECCCEFLSTPSARRAT